MSDDEETMMMNGTGDEKDTQAAKNDENSSTSDDDDSSSSSSGSSSSSDSSDSESDGESGENQQQHQQDDRDSNFGDRKYSIESVASSNGFASQGARHNDRNPAEPLNANSNRAAARFREQNSEVGLMALGTKKRDRRTIEEIQRDLQKRRGRGALSSSNGGSSSSFTASKPPMSSSSSTVAVRASPPKGSPVLSPEPGDSSQLTVGPPQIKMPKGKPNSARSRLTMKLLGRGRSNPVPATKAPAKKVSATTSAPGTGMVTNISAGAKVASKAVNDLDSYVEQRLDQAPPSRQQQLESKIEPRIVDWKPDGKVVRALLRGMLRFGDLTDVGMFKPDRHNSFADEFKLQNFVVRSHLPSSTKASEEQLLKTATEITERAQRAIEDKQDNMKYADVEIKPSQVIERLYENLKLRVAVQRALRDAKYAKRDDKGAYVLVAKQSDLPVLGIPRDFPPWSWAEKEHDWNSRKDTALLLGIYVHGFGAWEDILNDDLLHFHQQRALKGERMKKRAENLLKRLSPPDESGDPKIVHSANALVAGSQNSGPSLGAQFSAIINSNNPNKGRLERAAQRFAARQSSGALSIPESRVVAEDSIRRSHTQASSSSSSISSSNNAPDRQRKTSLPSSSPRNDEPEDGEVGGSSSAVPSSSAAAAGRSSTSSKSSSSSKRAASIETEQSGGGSPRKKSKHHSSERSRKHRDRDASSIPSKKKARILTEEQCMEKWKPSKKLKEIRQVLKKMKIMADWSKNQTDEVVVEKVSKYVITIGEAIDDIVRKAQKDGEDSDAAHELDELCTCLWSYAAGYTPFSSLIFERLYDDICADGESLRQEEKRGRPTAST